MRKYVKPMIVVAAQAAEGVYMLSGGEPVTLEEALHPEEELDTTIAEGPVAGENSVGEAPQTENAEESEISIEEVADEAPADAQVELTETPADSVTEETTPAAETVTEDAGEPAVAETVAEDAALQAASYVHCDSKYMNGIWQRAQGGSWGNTKPTNKEMLGCTGCAADTGNGCGLLEPNADERYWRESGSLRPDWETAGKLPEDTPFGI